MNLWADLYAPEIPALEQCRPFVSKDAEFYGTRALAELLARRAGWEMHFNPKCDSIVAAILRHRRGVQAVADAVRLVSSGGTPTPNTISGAL